ncbi:hypothetical protein ABK040_003559 [Willaertia magna]
MRLHDQEKTSPIAVGNQVQVFKDEDRLKQWRKETMKRRKEQEMKLMEAKRKEEEQIEKALMERKEKLVNATKLRKPNFNKKDLKKVPTRLKDDVNSMMLINEEQIFEKNSKQKHCNLLESLDLGGVHSSTDMFLLAELLSKRESINASVAARKIKDCIEKGKEEKNAKSVRFNPQVEEITLPSSPPMNRVNTPPILLPSPRKEPIKLPEIKKKIPPLTIGELNKGEDKKENEEPETDIKVENGEKKDVKQIKLKKPPKPKIVSTGFSIDINKIEKDLELLDKALEEKYDCLRRFNDSNLSDRTFTDTPLSEPPPQTKYISDLFPKDKPPRKPSTAEKTEIVNRKPKKPKILRISPVFSNRVRKF